MDFGGPKKGSKKPGYIALTEPPWIGVVFLLGSTTLCIVVAGYSQYEPI